jgi:hypothetical protein
MIGRISFVETWFYLLIKKLLGIVVMCVSVIQMREIIIVEMGRLSYSIVHQLARRFTATCVRNASCRPTRSKCTG